MSVEHFEGLLNTTIKRLDKTCNEWQKFLDESGQNIPEDASCEIMSALGKTNLLLKSKLPQFRRLVDDLRRGQSGERPIKAGDLQGFWDLISLEISEVDERFENIQKRKSTSWAPLETKTIETPPKKVEKLKNGVDKTDAAKGKNFDHLRSAAKQRLALAKAKMQENMKNNQEESKENGQIQCNVSCTAKERDFERLSIC